jgi:hypothetical protein
MHRSIIAGLATVASLGFAAPAEAITSNDARRAVKRELRQLYEVRYPTIRCFRLTTTRISCRWRGLSDTDVFEGNVDGWRGVATVRQRRFGVSVSFRILRYGY